MDAEEFLRARHEIDCAAHSAAIKRIEERHRTHYEGCAAQQPECAAAPSLFDVLLYEAEREADLS